MNPTINPNQAPDPNTPPETNPMTWDDFTLRRWAPTAEAFSDALRQWEMRKRGGGFVPYRGIVRPHERSR